MWRKIWIRQLLYMWFFIYSMWTDWPQIGSRRQECENHCHPFYRRSHCMDLSCLEVKLVKKSGRRNNIHGYSSSFSVNALSTAIANYIPRRLYMALNALTNCSLWFRNCAYTGDQDIAAYMKRYLVTNCSQTEFYTDIGFSWPFPRNIRAELA